MYFILGSAFGSTQASRTGGLGSNSGPHENFSLKIATLPKSIEDLVLEEESSRGEY